MADLAAGVDFAALDTDGILAAMDAAAAAYTEASGNEIDLSALVDEQTAVPEPPEDAGDDFDSYNFV